MKKLILVIVALLALPTLAFAADVTLSWNASTGATGYKVQMSTDVGVTWTQENNAGVNTTYIWLTAPDSGLLLFRAIAYNEQHETIRTEAGAWYNGDWKPPSKAGGLGIE